MIESTNIVFALLITSALFLLFNHCNNSVNKVKNEQFYSPKLKLNIPSEPMI